MSMTLEGIFSRMESVSRKFDNKEGKIENIKEDFDETLGIRKEKHDAVASLIEQFEDSEETLKHYETEISNTEKSLKELDDAINDLKNDLAKTNLSANEHAQKQNDLDSKTRERDRLDDKRNKIDTTKSKEELRNSKIKAKLSNKGVTDTQKAIAAKGKMDASIASASKGGGMTKALGSMKGNAYLMIAQAVIGIIEFGIGKAMEYQKVFYANTMRAMTATTTDSVNRLKAGVESWQDSVKGAYSAQELSVETQLAVMDAANQTELANMKLEHTWTSWIPILGKLNEAEEQTLELKQQINKMELENAQKLISSFKPYVTLTDDYIRKQDDAIHKFQALNGLTVAQTQAFEKRMLAQGEAFAKFNKTIDDALKMQKSYTEQSGRSVNFTNKDFTQSFAVGRLVGEDTLTQFQSMMNIFNTSVSDSTDTMYDMYNYANKMGLSQQKLTKNVLSNLKVAEKYNFKNGTKGFVELAKWAENMRFNVSSMDGMLDKVQTGGLEGVIKQAAELQVLGGHFAMGADPLAMAYESYMDPEAYAKRMNGMIAGQGYMKEDGSVGFGITSQMMMRQYAESTGQDYKDVLNQARAQVKLGEIQTKLNPSQKFTEDQQTMIANKAQYDQETGKWFVTTLNGERKNVEDVQMQDIGNLVSDNAEENAEVYAKGTFSAVESIEMTTKAIAAKLGAATFDDFINTTETANRQTIDAFTQNLNSVASAIGLYRQEALTKQKDMFDKFGTLDKDVKDAFKTVSAYETENKKKLEDLKTMLANQKAEQEAAHEKTVKRWQNVTEARERGEDGYWGNIKKGQDIQTARAKYASSVADEHGANGDWDKYLMYKAKAACEQSIGRYIQFYTGSYGYNSNFTDDIVHHPINTIGKAIDGVKSLFDDGIANSGGQPISVAASSVVPVHDGKAKVAKSDPHDTAIFAKTGGPFDKLFNDVFGRINEVYNIVHDSVSVIEKPIDNALTMAYEAFMDPEAYTKRMDSMVAKQGRLKDDGTIGNTSIIDTFRNRGYTREDGSLAFSITTQQMMHEYAKSTGQNYMDVMNQVKSGVTPRPMPYDSFVSQSNSFDRGSSNGSISLSPLQISINGNINLNGSGRNSDITEQLAKDQNFIRALSQLISVEVEKKVNGGKVVNLNNRNIQW